MSLPWKSELLLRLSREACTAQRLAPWSRRVVAQELAEGDPAVALPAVLRSLRASAPLPATARLLLADEQVYLALRPAQPLWQAANNDAEQHFSRTLSRSGLAVAVAECPGGSLTLAAAMNGAELVLWREALAAEGVRLASVGLALLDDLGSMSQRVGERAVLALLRREGVSLLRVEAGQLVEYAWERCDPDSLRCIEQRILAFAQTGVTGPTAPTLLLCPDTRHLQTWDSIARGHHWKLMIRQAPAPMEAAA